MALLVRLLPLLRALLIQIAQLGATALAFLPIDWFLNKVQGWIREYYDISENDSGAVLANLLLDITVVLGISTAVMMKKLPINFVKRVGLDSANPKKLAISATAATKIKSKDAAAAGKGTKDFIEKVIKIAGIPAALVWLTSAIANIVEPGIYKPEQTNAVYNALGIPFQYPTGSAAGSPGGFDPGEFTDYHRALETAGAKFIDNPCKATRVAFSRTELVALVDCIYGQEAAKVGGATTPAKLKGKLAQYIVLSSGASAPSNIGGTSSGSTGNIGGTSYALPKIFTGVVSQGVLGTKVSFEARPDDLIESDQELREVAQKNLAELLRTLPGTIVWEIKIVSSVTSRDGFTQRGASQRVQSGTNKDGTPKYKTVVNKFAVLYVYIITEKGTRTKIRQITLGPTDVVQFNPTAGVLVEMAQDIKDDVITDNPAEIIGNIATPEPEEEEQGSTWNYIMDGSWQPPQYTARNTRQLSNGTTYLLPDRVSNGQRSLKYEDVFGSYEAIIAGSDKDPAVSGGSGAASASSSSLNDAARNAGNLSQYYAALGQSLPPLSVRAGLYADLGLGQASFYTGTSEQNGKLLAALKGR